MVSPEQMLDNINYVESNPGIEVWVNGYYEEMKERVRFLESVDSYGFKFEGHFSPNLLPRVLRSYGVQEIKTFKNFAVDKDDWYNWGVVGFTPVPIPKEYTRYPNTHYDTKSGIASLLGQRCEIDLVPQKYIERCMKDLVAYLAKGDIKEYINYEEILIGYKGNNPKEVSYLTTFPFRNSSSLFNLVERLQKYY